jgi:uncharacterized protein YuzE
LRPQDARRLRPRARGLQPWLRPYLLITRDLCKRSIDLAERPSTESREVSPGIVLDFDAAGYLVGIDIDNASQNLELSRLETVSLPLTSMSLTGT